MDTKRVEQLEKELTVTQYFRNIWEAVSSLIKGIRITGKYIYSDTTVSIEYPEVREILPDNSRSRLFNDVENCISCMQCATACPVDCIYIAANKRDKEAEKIKTKDGTPIRLNLTQYTIDTALCCYCGLCTTVCPTQCLTHTKDYEFAQYTIADMKYDYLQDDIKKWRERIVK